MDHNTENDIRTINALVESINSHIDKLWLWISVNHEFFFLSSFFIKNPIAMNKQTPPTTMYVMDKNSFLEPKKLDCETTKYFWPRKLLIS